MRDHPFVDGNKRAAHLIAITFIEVNGFGVAATEDEQFDLLVGTAAGALDMQGVEDWLEKHVVAGPEST